ncbi:MAG: co-chaperone DjlA [Gammaproteobacteria bacterium]|nr:co-chaperone DjlA [Gammaproteobacteria bacterium]
MMHVFGKILGGIFGFLFLGIFGAILGAIIGHFFDRGMSTSFIRFTNRGKIQQAFFTAAFSVMGHVAKSDGRVSEQDIAIARSIMQHMGLDEAGKHRAIALFTVGKQANFELTLALAKLKQACHHSYLLRLFLDMQIQAAYAEGQLREQKKALLQSIAQQLNFPPINFAEIEQLIREKYYGFQQGYTNNQQSYQNRQTVVEDAYKLLHISSSASDTEVKRAYRRQMSKHHPDKLVSKGLPPEMIKLANEKTHQIKKAYEQICRDRNL